MRGGDARARSSRCARRAISTGTTTAATTASLAALLGDGPPNPDQIKRLTRAGMGACQGRRCREQVAALLALGGGVPLSAIPLAELSRAGAAAAARARWPIAESRGDAGRAMGHLVRHARAMAPVLGRAELYTVASNDATGPVASE